jgi:uncharacterized protein
VSLRRIAARSPLFTALCCAGSQFLITVLILKAGIAFFPREAFGKVKLVAFASTVLVPLLLVQALGLWRRVGFETDRIRPSPIFLVSLLSCALFLSMGVSAAGLASFAGESLMQFVNAFGEELLFRGVIFAILLTLPRWQAIAVSGVLFGSMHLIHGFMDASFRAALLQAAITSMAGMMFAAVRYATGSLWLTILLHMLLNLAMLHSKVDVAGGPTAMLVVERLANAFELALAAYVIAKSQEAARAPISVPTDG